MTQPSLARAQFQPFRYSTSSIYPLAHIQILGVAKCDRSGKELWYAQLAQIAVQVAIQHGSSICGFQVTNFELLSGIWNVAIYNHNSTSDYDLASQGNALAGAVRNVHDYYAW